MKKVKNPRSGLSWSEITLVLIKKTIRLVLKFESGWHCFWRWADWCSCCSSVVPFSLSPCSPLCLWYYCPLSNLLARLAFPLWHSMGSKTIHVLAALAMALCWAAWVVLGAVPAACVGGSGCHRLGAVGKSFVSRISRCLCNYGSRSTPYSFVLQLCTNWAGLSKRTDEQRV